MIDQHSIVDRSEKRFTACLAISAIIIVVLLLAVFLTLLVTLDPCHKAFGIGFFYSKDWNPALENSVLFLSLWELFLHPFWGFSSQFPFSIGISVFLGILQGRININLLEECYRGSRRHTFGQYGLWVYFSLCR